MAGQMVDETHRQTLCTCLWYPRQLVIEAARSGNARSRLACTESPEDCEVMVELAMAMQPVDTAQCAPHWVCNCVDNSRDP